MESTCSNEWSEREESVYHGMEALEYHLPQLGEEEIFIQ